MAWVAGYMASTAMSLLFLPDSVTESQVVSLGSGFIAAVALVPGLLQERAASRPIKDYSAVLLASVLLRLLGTVALFAMCSYHMAQTVEITAAFTVGWYLYLTSFEVGTLIRQLSSIDGSLVTQKPESTQNIPNICQG